MLRNYTNRQFFCSFASLLEVVLLRRILYLAVIMHCVVFFRIKLTALLYAKQMDDDDDNDDDDNDDDDYDDDDDDAMLSSPKTHSHFCNISFLENGTSHNFSATAVHFCKSESVRYSCCHDCTAPMTIRPVTWPATRWSTQMAASSGHLQPVFVARARSILLCFRSMTRYALSSSAHGLTIRLRSLLSLLYHYYGAILLFYNAQGVSGWVNFLF